MSLLYSLQTTCGNCGKVNQICTISVAYRCIDCRHINCLMCNKTHDMTCELFSKSNKNVSISSTNVIKESSIGETSKNIPQKRSSSHNDENTEKDVNDEIEKENYIEGPLSSSNNTETDGSLDDEHEKETPSTSTTKTSQTELNYIPLKFLCNINKYSDAEIHEMYSDAAGFLRNNKVFREEGFKFLDPIGHVKKEQTTGNWKLHFDEQYEEPSDIPINQSLKTKKIYGCPFEGCDYIGRSTNVLSHLIHNHNPIKFMCPIGLPRHTVPIIANRSKQMEAHIQICHPGQKLVPIKIHARQIDFKFTLPHKHVPFRTTVAEMFLTREREQAIEWMNAHPYIDRSDWLNESSLSEKERKIYNQERKKLALNDNA